MYIKAQEEVEYSYWWRGSIYDESGTLVYRTSGKYKTREEALRIAGRIKETLENGDMFDAIQ